MTDRGYTGWVPLGDRGGGVDMGSDNAYRVIDEGMRSQMNQMRGLKTVRVEKAALLEQVKENRAEHRDRFEEAMEG